MLDVGIRRRGAKLQALDAATLLGDGQRFLVRFAPPKVALSGYAPSANTHDCLGNAVELCNRDP